MKNAITESFMTMQIINEEKRHRISNCSISTQYRISWMPGWHPGNDSKLILS